MNQLYTRSNSPMERRSNTSKTNRLFTLLLLASVPLLTPSTRVIEINTVYNLDTGEPRFTQAVGWDDHPETSCDHVRDWFMLEKGDAVFRSPHGYTVIRSDVQAYPEKVRCRKLLRTHTYYDKEEIDREIVEPEKRRGWWR